MFSLPRNWPLFFWIAILTVLTLIGVNRLPDPQDRRLFADQATHIMAAQSIWYDFDMQYTLEDLARFRETMPKEPGPVNAFLKMGGDDCLYFAKPFLYALFSSPFSGLLGLSGFMVFNALCLGFIGAILIRILEKHFSKLISLFLIIGLLIFSPFLAWTPIVHPDIFIAFLLTIGSFLLICSDKKTPIRLLGALMLGLVLYEKQTFIFIVIPLILVLAVNIGKKLVIYILIVIFIGWAIPSTVNWVQDGNFSPYKGLRFVVQTKVPGTFPLESGWDAASLKMGLTDAVFKKEALLRALFHNLSLLPSKFTDFLIGRQTSILLYFPVALFLLIYLVFHSTWRSTTIISGFFLYLAIQWLVFPTNGYGGSQTYGPRYIMQALPVLLIGLMMTNTTNKIAGGSSKIWTLMILVAFSLSVIMQHNVIPPVMTTVGYPADFLLSRRVASYFPYETSLLPVIAPMLPLGFYEKTRGNFIFRIDGQPENCFLSKVKDTVQENETVLYQLGRPATFPLMILNATQKMQVDFLADDETLATTAVEPEKTSYVQLNNLFSETYHCRLMGDVRWQRIAIRTTLDAATKQTTPTVLRVGFLEAAATESCPNQPFRLPKLYGDVRFNKPEDTELIYKIDDLYGYESWGRWSRGNQVRLRFKHSLPEHFMLVIVTHALGPNIGTPITVTAGATQATFTTQAQPQGAILKFTLSEPTDTLVFTIPKPVRPRDLGMGNDERQLGVGFGVLQIYQDR